MSFFGGQINRYGVFGLFLFLQLTLSACGSPSSSKVSRSFSQQECAGSFCSESFSAGEAEIFLENLQAGEEYILVFMNESHFYDRGSERSRLQINAEWSSALAPANEERLAQRIRGGRRIDMARMERNETISLPSNLFFPHLQRFNFDHELYIPHFSDYQSRDESGELRQIYVRATDNPQLSGELRAVDSLFREPQRFEMLAQRSLDTTQKSQFLRSKSCLESNLDRLQSIFGKPLQLDPGRSELQVVLSSPNGDPRSNGNVIGWISQLDRFDTLYGQSIPDSNFGEFVYISPRLTRNPSEICSTFAHEFLHLISMDHKLLLPIPESSRSEMSEVQRLKLLPEDLGLEEAAAQLIEELSEEVQSVFQKVRIFLDRPNGSSFSLEAVGQDAWDNLRSRGLNQLLVYHALHLYGGTLDLENARTQSFLRKWILSPDRGITHLATVVGMKPDQLIDSLFYHLAMSLYDVGFVEKFVPERVEGPLTSRGITWVDRELDSLIWSQHPASSFHPLQSEIPYLRLSQSIALPPQGVSFYRLLVPENSGSRSQRLYLRMPNSSFRVWNIRVR